MDVQCVLDATAGIGASPVWCEQEQALCWADIPGCQLHRFEPASDHPGTCRLRPAVWRGANRAAGRTGRCALAVGVKGLPVPRFAG